ncbi:MAG: SPOR domain-containing protein [Novosphingobium sp.]|nr:SPOR domain-containing protein [Novosphingobium sp.]
MRLPVNHFLPLAALALLGGCAFGGGKPAGAPIPLANGPAADYPVVIGKPFTIGNVTYTPSDQLNSDEVGYASVAPQKGPGVTASHKTLPLPSYAEVTSLDSGRTILVRMENRGPMSNDLLIELSPDAAMQLGLRAGTTTPIRVRRVNPPEQERAMLRSGRQAPQRMETPAPLLKVLNRKLAENSSLSAKRPPSPAMMSKPASLTTAKAPESLLPSQAATAPKPPVKPPARAANGRFVVQVAAFSTKSRADAVAAKLGANVSKPGRYWYVRLGPYASTADASGDLARAKAAGYSDARIQKAN